MAYYKHPSTVGGLKVDWGELVKYTDSKISDRKSKMRNAQWKYDPWSKESEKNKTCDHLAHLMERICSEVVPSGGYDCDGTSSNINRAQAFLEKNYRLRGVFDYSSEKVISSLYYGKLVYGRGSSLKNLKRRGIFKSKYVYGGGHAWVYDGYIRTGTVTVTNRGRTPVSSTNYRDYLHINWGWEGDCNGYYASGVFDVVNGLCHMSNYEVQTQGERDPIANQTGRPVGLRAVGAEEDRLTLFRYNLQVLTDIEPR